ncbi:MAG: carbohydrate ABC transporter permease [Planctomycetaceae bacterium]|nr:carbohydrate ABC transporter permease [Planctomycetaceae bacterium]
MMKATPLRIVFAVLVVIIVTASLFPFYYAVVSSLKDGGDLFRVEYWPANPTWDNFREVLTTGSFPTNILNSVIVATGVVVLSLFLSVTASYALARVSFKGKGLLLLTILSVSMFPQVAVLSGLFELLRVCGLFNRLPGLILANMVLTLPFTVWVLTTFMRELPKEVEEAAVMDGAKPWVIVSRVFLPMMWPSLVTTGLLAFISAWNEFLFALTFTLTEDSRTVTVAISQISGAVQNQLPWGKIMAASVIVTIPLVALVLIFQRKIVAGLTAGAVKG